MPRRHALALLACITLPALAAPSTDSPLTVNFIHPERYADAAYNDSFGGEKQRAQVQSDLAQHLQKLAQRQLPAGQTLSVDILDIDLAGQLEPMRQPGFSNVRVMRGATWPRLHLRYTLRQGDQVLDSADVRLSDMNYQSGVNRYSSGDRLRHEKALLDDWFAKLVGGKTAR